MKRALIHLAAILTAASLFTSCTHVGDSWLIGTSGFAAHDQIMLVRQTPRSFGYDRLVNQSSVHEDIGVFVKQKGTPDFLAETSTRDRHYFIFYYLGKRQAYACRTATKYSRQVEFSGPYPITPREYKLLEGFQKSSNRKAGAL